MNPFFSFDDDEFFGDLLLMGAAAGGGSVVQETATGNPLTFVTDLARPLKSLLIPFTPQQEGTGDPSPQNIRSILPWNGLSVFGGGKNLFDIAVIKPFNANVTVTKDGGSFSATNNNGYSVNIFRGENGDLIFPVKDGKYTISISESTTVAIAVYGSTDGENFSWLANGITIGSTFATFTVSGQKYIKFWCFCAENSTVTVKDFQLEAGQTVTAYEPYAPITETDISFPSPVYGGKHEAVSGKLMDGWKVETLDDSDAWTDGGTFISYANHAFTDREVGDSFIGVCSAFPIKNNVQSGTAYMRWGGVDAPNILIAPNGSGLTLEDVKTLSGQGKIVLCYPLATPQEIQLTPEQITALVGDNTIWSDADGSMTAVYLKKG